MASDYTIRGFGAKQLSNAARVARNVRLNPNTVDDLFHAHASLDHESLGNGGYQWFFH
jgi:hypothetical protein